MLRLIILCRLLYRPFRLLAVGGVDETNMADYLKAGVAGFGVGSNIIDKAALADGDYAKITALAEKYVQVVKAWQAI